MFLHPSFEPTRRCLRALTLAAAMTTAWAAHSPQAAASDLCVNPTGSNGCYTSIHQAVNHAHGYDVINVAAGNYAEDVTIGVPLSLIGAGAGESSINAQGRAHGIFVDGFHHPGLSSVIIAGFTVENALYEGVLVVNASDVTIRGNRILDNDRSPGLKFTGKPTGCPGQPGDRIYENDETGDCGGALHLIGVTRSIIDGNYISGNADGILLSDETAETRDNLISHNVLKNNPLECGIVFGSHPPTGSIPPYFAPHYGVDHNTVSDNISIGNGVQIGGSGMGLFSDGNGPGRVVGNVVIHNTLIGNGLGGVALHSHVGPSFGAPADDMAGNKIIGNFIAKNNADTADTATPGTVGININSGDGGSPVLGTVISRNVIRDEDVDVAVNTPAVVDVHLNDLYGGKVGVADVCAYDEATTCTGSIDATENYWGCDAGPGASACAAVSGTDIRFDPWLSEAVDQDGHHHQPR